LFFKHLQGGTAEITAAYTAGIIGSTAENLKAAAEGAKTTDSISISLPMIEPCTSSTLLKKEVGATLLKKGFAGDFVIRLGFKSGPRHHLALILN